MSVPTDNKWHLDKRVNISIILVLVAYGVAFFQSQARMDMRIAALEERAIEQKTLPTDMAVLKTELSAIRAQNDRMEQKLNKLAEQD